MATMWLLAHRFRKMEKTILISEVDAVSFVSSRGCWQLGRAGKPSEPQKEHILDRSRILGGFRDPI